MTPSQTIADLYRAEWGKIVAILSRQTGDLDLASDAAQEAFTAALAQWPEQGVPTHPRAWILQTARHKALDRLRREKRSAPLLDVPAPDSPHPDTIPDDRLRLIFTCCHPAIAPEARIALTLREVCGLTTPEIARAFLVSESTMAQRLVRAQRKIRDAAIPFVIPELSELDERLDAVLTVLYLVFNEGYAVTSGDEPIRHRLCEEAIYLAQLLRDLFPAPTPSELTGLLALMLLHDSRRDARYDAEGNLILLNQQDRKLWNAPQIARALPLVAEALSGKRGPYALQATIAALHCQAGQASETDWPQIAALYALLERIQPSPIVTLNRAVAVMEAHGPHAAHPIMRALAESEALEDYHLFHATLGEMQARLGEKHLARAAFQCALKKAPHPADRKFLAERLLRLDGE
jgi:RNA polymerase sigma-70 factor (ECF subfamily)